MNDNSTDTSPRALPGTSGAPFSDHPSSIDGAGVPSLWTYRPNVAEGAGNMGILHSLRRRWAWSAILGVLLAGAAGAAAWILQGPHYVAEALLKLEVAQQPLILHSDRLPAIPNDFDIFRGSQLQLVKSPFVVLAALRKPEVAELSIVRREEDPAGWIDKKLKVRCPKDSQILGVSLGSDEPREAAVLVNAIVDAYLSEVANLDQNERQTRLNELDRAMVNKDTDLRQKRLQLKELAERLGSVDTQALSAKQQMLMQQLGDARRQLSQVQTELWKGRGELKVQETLLAAMTANKAESLPPQDLAAALATDPAIKQLVTDLHAAQVTTSITKAITKPEFTPLYAGGVDTLMTDALRQQLATRRKELIAEVLAGNRGKVEADIARLKTLVATQDEIEKRLTAEVADIKKQADALGNQSVDVEMMRGEIKQLDDVLARISQEREQLKVELRSTSRVRMLQKAEPPEFPAQLVRFAIAAFAALAGFAAPVAFIVWRDTRSRYVNSAEEVSRVVGLNVIGSVPMVPARGAGRLAAAEATGRQRRWQTLFTESVNRIVASLLHQSRQGDLRVILVTSAVGGEGKTTLATQLAMSLARAGQRTLLVDYDLRRPALHEIFGVPLEPGICEVLREQVGLAESAHPTGVDNLSVLPAGRRDQATLRQMANGCTESLFHELRSAADYVILDGSPVLPVADMGFVCGHVDGTILAVLRDVSQTPRIVAAVEAVKSYGGRVVGAVVTDVSSGLYYENSVSQQ